MGIHNIQHNVLPQEIISVLSNEWLSDHSKRKDPCTFEEYGFIIPPEKTKTNVAYNDPNLWEIHVYDDELFTLFLLKYGF